MRNIRKHSIYFFCIQVIIIIIVFRKHWHQLEGFLRKRNTVYRNNSENSTVETKLSGGTRAIETRTVKRQSLTDSSKEYVTGVIRRRVSESLHRETRVSGNLDRKKRYPGMDLKANDQDKEFIRNWCRIQNARTNWQSLLLPCVDNTVWGEKHFEDDKRTDGAKSYVLLWDLHPAKKFSRFLIQSVSSTNKRKMIGGDSWRVHLRGPAVVVPTVFDLGNGIYEALFLIIEPGRYRAEIYLDYTLCNGYKDPPPYWFKAGNSQGKNQPDGILKGDKPFLIQKFHPEETVAFDIMAAQNGTNLNNDLNIERRVNCSCSSLLWDGLGRWTNGTWKPFLQETFQYRRPTNQQGTLFIFGDSITGAFYNSLTSGPYKGICNSIFTSCKRAMNWVYNTRGYWGTGAPMASPKEPLPDGKDYDQKRVLDDVREVLYHPEMNEHSVLLLNWGVHFAAVVNFTSYRNLINDFIRIVKHGETDPQTGQIRKFKGTLIWKTTTALNRHRFPNPHKDVRRFLTFPRILLFNAFATSAMCKAGIDVIDVYPISDAYPKGTFSESDPVHYSSWVFRDVERLLFKHLNPKQRI